eukprot:2091937-Pyramimonas_sp.AAC.2
MTDQSEERSEFVAERSEFTPSIPFVLVRARLAGGVLRSPSPSLSSFVLPPSFAPSSAESAPPADARNAWRATDWSVVRIYPHVLHPIGPSDPSSVRNTLELVTGPGLYASRASIEKVLSLPVLGVRALGLGGWRHNLELELLRMDGCVRFRVEGAKDRSEFKV